MGTRVKEWFPFWWLQQINTPTCLHPTGHTSPKWFIRYFHIFHTGKDQVRLQVPLAVFSEEKLTQNRMVATTGISVMLDCHTVSLLPGNLPWNSEIITTKEKRSQLEKQCETITERAGYSISKQMKRRWLWQEDQDQWVCLSWGCMQSPVKWTNNL